LTLEGKVLTFRVLCVGVWVWFLVRRRLCAGVHRCVGLVSDRDMVVSDRDVVVSDRDVVVSDRDVVVSDRDVVVSW